MKFNLSASRVLVGVLAAMCCLCAAPSAFAAEGDLDTTFSGDGIQITPIGAAGDGADAVAIQADGKIVTAGYSWNGTDDDFAVVRYNADGSLDASFGTAGKVTTPIGASEDQAKAVAIQADGKIVTAGHSWNGCCSTELAVVRYNVDGSLDASFGTAGKVTTSIGGVDDRAYGVAIQADGKIVTGGHSTNGGNFEFAVVRYNADGSLDASFGTAGMVTTPIGTSGQAKGVAIQADGKIVTAGFSYNGTRYDFAVVRYNVDGSLDASFGTAGMVTTPIGGTDDKAYGVAIQADGKIVTAGPTWNGTDNDLAVVRYNVDGSLDASFGTAGKVTTPMIGTGYDYALGVAIQADGKIVTAGSRWNGTDHDFAVVRYLGDTVSASNPALVSASHTTGQWSNDRTVAVAMTGAVDGNTGVDGFSYEWTASATTTPDAIKDAEQSLATLTSPSLSDGASHYFHLRTVDNAGNWSAAEHLGPFKIDGTAPTSMIVSGTALARRFQSQRSFVIRWSASTGISGRSSYRVRYRAARYNGLFGSQAVWKSSTAGTSASFTGTPGYTYCFSARATDNAGNTTGYSAERCTAIPLDDRALSRSGAWFRGSGSGYYLGTYSLTSTPGAALSTSVSAKRISVIVTRCPGCGVVDVYFAGTKIARVNLNAASWDSRVFVSVASFTRVRSGKLVLRAASGKPVRIEGVGVSRV